jgi:hypothetical protein
MFTFSGETAATTLMPPAKSPLGFVGLLSVPPPLHAAKLSESTAAAAVSAVRNRFTEVPSFDGGWVV